MINIKVSQLMPLVDHTSSTILDWTVGFAKAVEHPLANGDSSFDAILGGTGVLVSANGRYAILTADHVLQNLPKAGPVGLILLGRRGGVDHQFTLEMDYMQKVTVGGGGDEALGPDLALIVLPRIDVNRLEVWKSFYNLSTRKSKMLIQPPANEVGPWVMDGLVGEMTQEMPALPGMTKKYSFKGLCGPVRVPRSRWDGRFDYFSVEVNSGDFFNLPRSFGGCSGSGLWRLMLRQSEGKLVLDDLFLGGIAFYQSPSEDGRRFIECHGCKSIYGIVEEILAGNPR